MNISDVTLFFRANCTDCHNYKGWSEKIHSPCRYRHSKKIREKNELGHPYSLKATKFLAGLVLGKDVCINEYGTDRYGRVLGVLYSGKINVNLEMVRIGYAEVYRSKAAKGFNSDPYWKAEEQARSEN